MPTGGGPRLAYAPRMAELTDDPANEGRHLPDGERYWNESWYLDFVSDDGTFGGYVRTGLYPNLGVCWYWACVVGEGRPLVTLIDHEVAIPAEGVAVRGDGLWTDYVVETPWEHVSLGLEGFGVTVDHPAEPLRIADPRDLRGERTAIGLELDWETEGTVFPFPFGITRYEVPCRVHGEVLVGDERIEFSGSGQRDHSWGVRDWWAMSHNWCEGALSDGTRFHGTHALPGWGDWSIGYIQPPGGVPVGELNTYRTEPEFDADQQPARAHMAFSAPEPGLDLEVEVVAHSPVLLVSPDGDESRFPRSMVRYREADGRTGVGWIEYGLPQPPLAPPTA